MMVYRAFSLNKIYRSINSLQITFLLPLMNFVLNGNIEIVYVFFESNTNMNFDCSANKDRVGQKKFKEPGSFYDLPKTENEGGTIQPFSYQFEAEGYESLFMIENIGSTLSNIEKVTYVTITVLVIVHFIQHVLGKNFKFLKKVTDKF